MTNLDFIQKKNDLLKIKEAQEKVINQNYTDLCNEFIEHNSPVKDSEVYELIENGNKRRGFKRFVIYDQKIRVMGSFPMITVGGWWLNSENVPTKWDDMTVSGIGNPAVFKVSENQINLKHPDSTDAD